MQIYISPTQTRERWWQPAVPRTPVGAVTGLAGPLLRDQHPLTSPSTPSSPRQRELAPIPRAVCERYKPDRRRSGRGSGFPGSEPTGGTSCIPPVPCAQREGAHGGGGLWLPSESRVASTWLCGDGHASLLSTSRATACRGQERQSQEEDERPHAMLPSRLAPHAAAGFAGVKFKESQQRQLFGPPGITVSPSQASFCLLPRWSPS